MRIAVLHPHATQADRVAESIRSEGHEVSVLGSVLELLASVPRRFEIAAVQAGALAQHEPRAELAALRSAGTQLLALASADDADRVSDTEVDDFLFEPLRPEELRLRLAALGRRAHATTALEPLEVAPYAFVPESQKVSLHGCPVRLTTREFELATYFFRRVGRQIARRELCERVWGHGPLVESRTLDAHVSTLRRKLVLEPRNGFRLAAQYGHGYCLQPVATP